MFTYVYLGTNDLERATRFYDAAMASLGLRRCVTNDPEWDRISAGWGTYEDGGVRELALWVGKPFDQRAARISMRRMCAIRMATSSLLFVAVWESAAAEAENDTHFFRVRQAQNRRTRPGRTGSRWYYSPIDPNQIRWHRNSPWHRQTHDSRERNSRKPGFKSERGRGL